MRTAITTVKKHDGKWDVLALQDEAVTEQFAFVRSLLNKRTHPEYAEVHYQESDQPERVFRFQPEPREVSAKTSKK